MKKVLFLLIASATMAACNNETKEAEKPVSGTEEAKPAAAGNDAALQQWLSGKMLVSTQADPKMDMWHNFKMNADGSCTDKDNSTAKWAIKDGEFIFTASMEIKKKLEKKDDSTLIFKGALGGDEYKVKPIQ